MRLKKAVIELSQRPRLIHSRSRDMWIRSSVGHVATSILDLIRPALSHGRSLLVTTSPLIFISAPASQRRYVRRFETHAFLSIRVRLLGGCLSDIWKRR